MTIYLSLLEVLFIHQRSVDSYGGANGLRDAGQLEAALFRPQTGYYKDIIEQAAALWESLSQNHPFVDGNKRTAFLAMLIFLKINGYGLNITDQQAQTFILGLYDTGQFSFANIEPWLRQNCSSKS